jgi:hypothetical protein
MAGHSRPKDGVATARLCPAIHVFGAAGKDVDARDKPVHDEEGGRGAMGCGGGLGRPPPFIPTISGINISPVPQVLGQFRLMWYLAGTSFDRHT